MESDSSSPPGTAGAAARGTLSEGVDAAIATGDPTESVGSVCDSRGYFNMPSPAAAAAAAAAAEEEHYLVSDEPPEQAQQQQQQTESRQEMSSSSSSIHPLQEEEEEEEQQQLRSGLHHNNQWILQATPPPLHDIVQPSSWPAEAAAGSSSPAGSSRLIQDMNSCGIIPLCPDPALDFCIYTQTSVPLPASLCHSAAATETAGTCPPPSPAHSKGEPVETYDSNSNSGYQTPRGRSASHYNSRLGNNYGSNSSSEYDDGSSYARSGSNGIYESSRSSNYSRGRSSSSSRTYDTGRCRDVDTGRHSLKYERISVSSDCDRGSTTSAHYHRSNSNTTHCDSNRDYDSSKKYEDSSSREFQSSSSREYESKNSRDFESRSSREYESTSSREFERSSSSENAASLGCSLSTPLSPNAAAVAASVAAEAAAEAETDVEADPERNGSDGLVKKASPLLQQRWATRDLSMQQVHDYLAAVPVDKNNNLAAAALPEETSKERDISDTTGVNGSKQGRAAPSLALFDTCEPRSSATCSPHVQQQQLYSPLQQQPDAAAAATYIDTSQVTATVEDTPCALSPVAHIPSKGAAAVGGIGGTSGERQRKRNAGGGGGAAGTASGSKSKGGAGRGGERRRKTQQQTGAAEKRDGERRQRRSNSNNETGRGRGSTAGRGASRLQRNSLLLLPPVFPFADKPPVGTSPCGAVCKEAFFTTAQQLAAAAAVMPVSTMLMEGEEGGAAETAALPLQEQQQRICLESGTHAQQQVKHASCMQSPLRYGAGGGAVSPLSPDPHPTLMSGAMAADTQQQQQQQNRTSSFTNHLSSPLVLSGSAFRTLDACSNRRNGDSSRGSSNSTVRYTSPESLPLSSSSSTCSQQQQSVYPRIMRTSASAPTKATTAPATAQLCTFSSQQWDPFLSSDQPLLYFGGNPRTGSSPAGHLTSSSSHAAAPAAAALSTHSPPSSPLLPPFSSSRPLLTTSSSLGEAAAATSGRTLTSPGTGPPAPTSPSGSLAAVPQAAAAGPGASSGAMTVGGNSSTSFCGAEPAAGEQSCYSSATAAPASRYLSLNAVDHTYSVCSSSSSAADRLAGTPALTVAPEVPQHQQEQQRETGACSNTRGDSSGSSTLLNNSCARCSTCRSSSGNSSSRSSLTSPSGYESSSNSNSSCFPNPPNSCNSNPGYSSTLSTSSPSYNNTSNNHLASTYNSSGRFERSPAARPPQERQQRLQPDDNYGGCCEEVDQSAAGRNRKLSPTYHSRLREAFAGLPSPSSSVAASCASSHKGIGEPAALPSHSRLISFSSSTHPLHALDKHTSPENDSGTPAASPCESLTNAYSVGGAAGTATIEGAAGTSCESLNSPAPTERLCGSSGCSSGGGGNNGSKKREKGSNGIVAGGGASSFQSASSSLPSPFSPSSSASAPPVLPATFPSTFSPSCSSALPHTSLHAAHRRGSAAAALRQPPAAATGGRRLLVGGSSAAAGTAAGEQQQQESFGGANGGDTLCEGLSSNIHEFNSTATAAATHMSILSNVLYSSYEPSNHLKTSSPFPLSAATAGMQPRDPATAAAAAANGSPLGRHVAIAAAAGNNAVLPVGAAAVYNNPTPRALSPTTLSTQTSVHEDAVTTCAPENSSSSSTEVAAAVGAAAAGARSAATAVHALRQQQLGAQHLLFQATLQDALASTDSYAQPPLSYSNNSSRASGGVIGGTPSSSFSSSHIEELPAASACNSAAQQQYPRCPAAGGSGGQFVCVPLSSQNSLTNNVTAAAAATPCLDMFPPACVMLPNAVRQQQQQSNSNSRVGEGNGRHHEAAVTIATDGWMTVASCCSGGSSRVEREAAGGSGNAAWQDPQQQQIRDCFQYYLRERQHHAEGFCSAAASTGFAAAAAAPLHAHYKRSWGREDVVAEDVDATATGTAGAPKKFKLDGTLYSRNAVLGEDDWHDGHTVAAEAAAAALVAAAAVGACSAAGAGAFKGTCNNAAAAAPGDGSSCCSNSGSVSSVGGPLRLPRKIFNDGRRWSEEFIEESDVDIDPSIQWHEGFTLPLGKDGRGELIKRMRAVHKADREFYRFTLEEMGIDFKRLAHATVEELWKIAFRWGLFPYAIRLSRKYGRTNATSSRKKTLAIAGAGTMAGGAAGGDAGTGRFPLSHSSYPSSSSFPSSSNASAFPSTSGPQHAPPASSTNEAKSSMPTAEEAAQAGAVSTTCEPPDLSSPHGSSFCTETVNAVTDVDWV